MASVKVDLKAPDFELKEFNGETFKLSDYKGKSNVLIVLNRGFVWPFCQKHMMQLHQDYNEFLQRDTEIVAIGPEKADKFESYWQEHQLQFHGLPDDKNSVLKLYGQEVNLFKLGRMPAQMLVDKNGVLRYVHYGHSMKDIPENQEILDLIDSMT